MKIITELLIKLRPYDETLNQLINLVKNKKNKKIILDLPILLFFELMNKLKPQQWGSLVEARIKKDVGYDDRKSRDSGDCSKDGKNYEIKCSFITPTNTSINLRQVRLWQKCDYIILAVDSRIPIKSIAYLFKLTHSEMEYEVGACKAGNSHGTKNSNKDNANVELSFSVKFDNGDINFIRWCEKYRISTPWGE